MAKKLHFEKRHGKKFKYTAVVAVAITATTFFVGMGLGLEQWNNSRAEAAQKNVHTVDLRIIGTTDLHGELNSMNYEQGIDYLNGGLARAFDLIEQTRNELPRENTFTLDAGDVMFDYTTEYIYSEKQEAIQPIFQAMAKVGYDAITLGNHEFDYGYDYLLRQLNGSGLREITVVSNVVDSKTGEYPFLENMLLTRSMKTTNGEEVEVTVGIIGQTIPNLNGKTHSYAGILRTEDMVENAKWQAKKLKEMGADVIIALSHTGIGPEKPELNFKNVAYALTKIPEIDVVVGGHEHNLYPTTDMTSPYFKLPGVDKKTYLMNGKNVIMAGHRARAIGVVDLTLEVVGDNVRIIDRSSEIKFVTSENTEEDETIASMYGEWEDKLKAYTTDIIGELPEGIRIQNFYGMLGDNTAIQLLNDAKINYTLKFVNTTGKQYRDYPIVAASTYASYGATSINDYIDIKEQITESDLAQIQPYNSYLYVYEITGAQLKEWLEWSASAYETRSLLPSKWDDPTMSNMMKETGLKSLIREEWIDDWSSFFVFDGVDYVIDPSVNPRYDFSGNRVSNTERVKSITYNGKEVTEDMKLLLATNKITKPMEANRGIEKQVALKSFVRVQSALGKYINQLSKSGSILPQVDYNWHVELPKNYKFITKAPYYAHDLIKETEWYVDDLGAYDQYRYYSAMYSIHKEDTTAPHLVITPVKTDATASAYDVAVNAVDASEIKHLRYMKGEFAETYVGWPVARKITNSFTVHENEVYTIYAEDIYGNKTVRTLIIDNFSDELLGTPTLVKYTNRKTKISGTAEPGATIIFEAYTGTFEGKVDLDGKFSWPLPAQPSGTEVTVFVRDELTGVESDRITVPVHRTGPNQPYIHPITNTAGYLTGNLNDEDATVVVIIEDVIYVGEDGGKERYLNASDLYDPNMKIVEVPLEVFDSGYFVVVLPPQEAGKQVNVYNLDHLSRNSRVNTTVVDEVGPNAPFVYEISNIERSLNGYVPYAKTNNIEVSLKIGDNEYKTTTDKNGNFAFDFEDQLYAGQILEVYARDIKNGTPRVSYVTEVTVTNIQDYVKDRDVMKLGRITTNSSYIVGNFDGESTIYLAITQGEGEDFTNTIHRVKADEFTRILFPLEEKLPVGARIYLMYRFTDGRIIYVCSTEVLPMIPEMPSLLRDATNTDKKIKVVAEKDCEITLTIGKKTYRTKEYQYDEETKQYIYSLDTDRDLSGTKLTITATNVTGTSDEFTSQLVKVSPDAPKVNVVNKNDTVVIGKIELLDYKNPEIDDEDLEKLPKEFKDAPKKVASTQTKVFAKIGKKTYQGTLDNKGNFEIKVPKQKLGTAIKVWGTNKAGRGPLIKVKVQ